MIRHISGIAEIVDSVPEAVRFYRNELGLQVDHTEGDPYAIIHVPGVIHVGVWDRAFAAERIHGDPARAHAVPLGFIVGFEVDDPTTDIDTVGPSGTVIQPPHEEPWGQQTTRFLTPGGALCEFTRTPWARRLVTHLQAVGQDTDN